VNLGCAVHLPRLRPASYTQVGVLEAEIRREGGSGTPVRAQRLSGLSGLSVCGRRRERSAAQAGSGQSGFVSARAGSVASVCLLVFVCVCMCVLCYNGRLIQ